MPTNNWTRAAIAVVALLLCSAPWAAAAIQCDGREIICDPVPGAQDDGEVFNGGYILNLGGSVGGPAEARYLCGEVQYRFPDLPAGILTFEAKGFDDDDASYFFQLNNSQSRRAKNELQAMTIRNYTVRVELQKYGCCEAPNMLGKKLDRSSEFTQIWIEWNPATINMYQGPIENRSLIISKPNTLGVKYVQKWGHGVCKNRTVNGPIIPSELELPEHRYGRRYTRLCVRNVRLVPLYVQ